jgi:hypothetical protein
MNSLLSQLQAAGTDEMPSSGRDSLDLIIDSSDGLSSS